MDPTDGAARSASDQPASDQPAFEPASYGDGLADVYDDWYGDLPDGAQAVNFLASLAGTGPVLELGIGTGRLALPLAARGIEVQGVDASPAMLARLRAKPGGADLVVTVGDMAEAEPAGPFSLVFVATNTLFNLGSDTEQRHCLANVERRLKLEGRFVVEAYVPDDEPDTPIEGVRPQRVDHDRVVLSVWKRDVSTSTITGQYVDISESGIRLRPWRIRYATPDQIDQMAAEAGLELESRWEDWEQTPFGPDSDNHVSVYRKRG